MSENAPIVILRKTTARVNMIRIRKPRHVPHVSSDTFRDLRGNLKFYQKGIPGEHNAHLKNSMVDFGRKRT